MQTARALNKGVLPALRHHLAFFKNLGRELTGSGARRRRRWLGDCRRYLSAAPHMGDVSFAGDMREDADPWPNFRFAGPSTVSVAVASARSTISRNPRGCRTRGLGSMLCVRKSVLLDFIAAQGPRLIHLGSRAKSCGQVDAERMLLRLTTSSRAFSSARRLMAGRSAAGGTHRDSVSRRRSGRRWRVREARSSCRCLDVGRWFPPALEQFGRALPVDPPDPCQRMQCPAASGPCRGMHP